MLLCAWVAAAQVAETLVGGPYVIHVSRSQATIAWVVRATGVLLGESPDRLEPPAPVLEVRKKTHGGLRPGTTYYYDALGLEAGKGRFKTAPDGEASFRFVVYGDTRSRHDMHRRVASAISQAEPDFVVHTGDLVADGRETSQWPVFFEIETELLRKTVFFPVLGNHERNSPHYHEFFSVTRPYYSFDWGAAHFILLNSDVGNTAPSPEARDAFWQEQTRWLEQDLEKSKNAALRFAVFHHPPISSVKRRQGTKHRVQEWVPLLEKYGVTAVFSGHDHNYQHHLRNGVHYIVTGGGGAPLYDVDVPHPGITLRVARTEHFVETRVEGRNARVHAFALDGSVIDMLTLGDSH